MLLNRLVSQRARLWLESNNCAVRQVVDYIKKRGFLREPQIEAIEIYLFLKIQGENKSLYQLFCEGFFSSNEDLSKLHISENARHTLRSNPAARALYKLSRSKVNGNSPIPDLEEYLRDHAAGLDCEQVIKDIFYGVDYPDYLFSLPMGAGKTFLMAAFIYLDLYFALNEPENKTFAHNFIILVPSGLKSSIIPSLKTIENFDPGWVLPEPAASNVKRLIKFEVLDQPKSAKKSNKARNPNAQKISRYQPFEDLMGLVMVTNAEKVILDRLVLDAQGRLYEQTEDEKDKAANELRNLIGKIPNLQILIDEVHHAATDDIKLRQVVNKWNVGGAVNGVLGFSGTPYLASAEKIQINDDVSLKFSQIANTVYYYPLTRAVQTFLKKPTVKPITELNSLQIVRRGVEEFYKKYENKIYANGTRAKLAIYCGSIERLEEEIYPYLVGDMKIPKEDILKYHRGNATHKISKDDEREFKSLDTPLSKKRIVLLVQIGKEGWDCKSLTGVILSQKGDCPPNMVLQTSCRCLRQVDRDEYETAGVWLNEDNAKTLDKQLREEQHTSIAEINNLGKAKAENTVERFARLDHLKLPPINFFQLKVEYDTLAVEDESQPRENVGAIGAHGFRRHASITERGLTIGDVRSREFLQTERGESADFRRWLFDISKGSFGAVSLRELLELENELKPIFEEISYADDGARYFNELYEQEQIAARVRLAFHQKRVLQTTSEVIPKSARMLIVEKLSATPKHDKLYPNEDETADILNADRSGKDIAALQREAEDAQKLFKDFLAQQGKADLFDMMNFPLAKGFSLAVRSKDRSFHFLPYNFVQSGFELGLLKGALEDKNLQDLKLEIYYNGEKDLTDFRILCHAQVGGRWERVGWYTPDFLLIQRRRDEIHRVLILETKGKGFASQKDFQARKKFAETEFLRMNNEKFGYRKFDYLYLSDENSLEGNLAALNTRILEFFRY